MADHQVPTYSSSSSFPLDLNSVHHSNTEEPAAVAAVVLRPCLRPIMVVDKHCYVVAVVVVGLHQKKSSAAD